MCTHKTGKDFVCEILIRMDGRLTYMNAGGENEEIVCVCSVRQKLMVDLTYVYRGYKTAGNIFY